jgi:hypothetical protein
MSDLSTTAPATPYDDLSKEEREAFDAKERDREQAEQAGKNAMVKR